MDKVSFFGRTRVMLAGVAVGILAVVSLLQIALGLGAPIGVLVLGGARELIAESARYQFWILAALNVIYGWGFVSSVTTNADRRPRLMQAVLFFVAFIFAMSTILNLIVGGPWERVVMLPLTALLSAIAIILLLSTRSVRRDERPAEGTDAAPRAN